MTTAKLGESVAEGNEPHRPDALALSERLTTADGQPDGWDGPWSTPNPEKYSELATGEKPAGVARRRTVRGVSPTGTAGYRGARRRTPVQDRRRIEVGIRATRRGTSKGRQHSVRRRGGQQ